MVATNKAAEAWSRADEERAFWRDHQGDYMEKYPNEFIALRDGQVVAYESSLDDLVAELTKQGLESTDVRIRYINACPGSSFL
jgi:hypothetical protein